MLYNSLKATCMLQNIIFMAGCFDDPINFVSNRILSGPALFTLRRII